MIPASGNSPGGGYGSPLQYSCLENPHGQRGLVGYSPGGRIELGTPELLTLSLFLENLSIRESEYIHSFDSFASFILF